MSLGRHVTRWQIQYKVCLCRVNCWKMRLSLWTCSLSIIAWWERWLDPEGSHSKKTEWPFLMRLAKREIWPCMDNVITCWSSDRQKVANTPLIVSISLMPTKSTHHQYFTCKRTTWSMCHQISDAQEIPQSSARHSWIRRCGSRPLLFSHQSVSHDRR